MITSSGVPNRTAWLKYGRFVLPQVAPEPVQAEAEPVRDEDIEPDGQSS